MSNPSVANHYWQNTGTVGVKPSHKNITSSDWGTVTGTVDVSTKVHCTYHARYVSTQSNQ
jgi:hypothetical protein